MIFRKFFKIELLIIACFFVQINSYYFQNVHFLISAKLNGTSPSISLNQLSPKSNYINFIFDFSYHSENVPDSKNTAYFKLNTNLDIPLDDEHKEDVITYKFFEGDWTEVKKMNVARNLIYKKVEVLSKEKNKYDNTKYLYFLKINKENENDNTLMIKVPTQRKKEGFISIENVLDISK